MLKESKRLALNYQSLVIFEQDTDLQDLKLG